MNFLKTISDGVVDHDRSDIQDRIAVRAVLFDSDGLVPILHVSKHAYHKLPGGGVDDGEDYIEALRREIKEEVGATAEISDQIGVIEEYRSE